VKEDLFKFLDDDGSLTIYLKVSVYLNVKQKTIVTGDGDEFTALKLFKGEERLMKKVAGVFGDEETSDVALSVVNDEDKEIRKFYCHTAILSGTLT